MKLHKLARNIALTTAVIIAPLAWLAFTNTGLNVALTASSWFAPMRISYQQASGRLWDNTVIIKNISIQENEHILAIHEIQLNWRKGTFNLRQIQGVEYFLPAQAYLALGQKTSIEEISGTITFAKNKIKITTTLHGTWQDAKLRANIDATYSAERWDLHNLQMQIGQNIARVESTTNQNISWSLNIVQPELIFNAGYGAILVAGEISNISNEPTINATINAKNFGFNEYRVQNLNAACKAIYNANAPLTIVANADKLVISNQSVNNIKINVTGKLQKHVLNATAKYDQKPITIQTTATLVDDLWQTQSLKLSYNAHVLQGTAKYEINAIKGSLSLQGKPFDIATDVTLELLNSESLKANLSLRANHENHLQANIAINKSKLNGTSQVVADDLSVIMQLLPDITRLKGHLEADANIRGTLQNPELKLTAHLTDITVTLPGLGVKIKPMELHINNEGFDKLIIKGKGKMRRGMGEFKIGGYIKPFAPNMPNELNIHGNNVEFINNTTAHLIANNQIQLSFDLSQQQLNIRGHIDVLSGNVYSDSKKTSTVKSKDVVFVDSNIKTKSQGLRINPDLNIWIFDGVHFAGFGLEADITGNIDITQRNDILYGSGRITIKQGTFQLPGQKLSINKGRLLYPVGTLLSNPSLDIKMTDRKKNAKGEYVIASASDLEILVRGTALSPTIHEANMAHDIDKAMSQAMLTGSSVVSKNFLQDKLKLSELGFANPNNKQSMFMSDHSSYDNPSHSNPTQDKNSFRNKDLVIGRPLGDRLYMQYLHSMASDKKRGRLKYALNKNWSLDVEAGNQGAGADLSFSIETD